MSKKESTAFKLSQNRLWIQAGFLLVWLDPLALRLHNICGPVLHCYACPLATFACPIGVLANFAALHIFPFAAIGTLVLVGAVFGRFICGFVCPFGLLQDLASRTPGPKITVPVYFSYARYFVLAALVFAIPYLYSMEHPLSICMVCPVSGIEAAIPNMLSQASQSKSIVWPNMIKIILTLAVIVSMFFVHRVWCYLCPLGAIFGLFNKFSLFIYKIGPSCTNCGACSKSCKMNLSPAKAPGSDSCIRCLDCADCKTGAIEIATPLTAKDLI